MTPTIVLEDGFALRVADFPEDMLVRLAGELEYPNPKYKQLVRMKKWTGDTPETIRNFEATEDMLYLPRGAADRLAAAAADFGVSYRIEDRRLDLPRLGLAKGPRAKPVTMRWYQEEQVRVAILNETCTLRAPTGSGKTVSAIELIERLDRPALVVVWTGGLLKQWVDRIAETWGWSTSRVGVIGGGKKSLGDGVCVALQQSLWRNPGLVRDKFAVVIADEAQLCAAETFRTFFSQMPARYRIAVSADERRKDKLECLIHDHFGVPAHEVKRADLINEGSLCAVDVVLVPTGTKVPFLERASYDIRPTIMTQRYRDILAVLEADEARNQLAARIAHREASEGRSTIVFCNRVRGEDGGAGQAHKLAAMVVVRGEACGLMLGGDENRDEFADTKRRLLAGDLKCAVASSAAYQGEDIPRLQSGVVVTPTAGNKQLFEQQVGRLRRKFPGKKKGTIYVLWDERVFPSHRRNLEQTYGRDMVRVEEW